jgi:Ca2+-binding RTX toxin-like protein
VAFTTQQGTGGAPWTFQGTPEADSIAVINGSTQDTVDFDFIAQGEEANDVINWNGVRSVTIRGGQGDDVITNNIAQSAGLATLITNSFINGNDGNDVIGNTQIGLQATLSTVSGGQAEDKIYIGSLQSTKVNGNRGADFIEIGDQRFDEFGTDRNNYANSSVFGGQGDDVIEVVTLGRAFLGSTVDGQLGNDIIGVQIGEFSVEDAVDAFIDTGIFDPEAGIITDPSFSGSKIQGGDGNDIIDASGLIVFDEVDEASGSDLKLFGDNGNDSIFGGAGDDLVGGDEGDDWIAGYAGRDTIEGGNGDDLVIGAYFDGQLSAGFVGDGAGDTLSGGTGSNRFFIPGALSAEVSGFFVNPLGSTFFVNLVENPDDALDGIISNGDLFSVDNGADVIVDWNSGAGNNVLDTTLGNTLAAFAGDPLMSFGFEYDGEVNNFAVRGFYTERFNEIGEFTVSEFGTDIAVWTNYTGEDVFGGLGPDVVVPTLVSNLTILKDVPTTTVVTANEFVAI